VAAAARGNLVDHGENYKYVYDAFGRLRKILNRGNDALVAEYRYNGLGYMIAIHEDADGDGDVDGDDAWRRARRGGGGGRGPHADRAGQRAALLSPEPEGGRGRDADEFGLKERARDAQ